MKRVRPPWVAATLLWLFLPKDEREFILGDLEEQYRQRSRQNRAGAWLWYWGQVARMRPFSLLDHPRPAHSGRRGTMALSFESFFQNVRFALRNLLKDRTFTGVATLTLAIGIGATTAIFSVVNSTLLRPLPFKDPDRLMRVSLLEPQKPGQRADDIRREGVWPYPKYKMFHELQTIFEDEATYLRTQFNLTGAGEPERLWAEIVGASYFSVLGIVAELGRGFSPETDGSTEAGLEVVLSHGTWVSRFGGNTEVLGRTINLDEIPYTVVGVMPSSFTGIKTVAQLWVSNRSLELLQRDLYHSYHVVARLKEKDTYDQARLAMRVLGDRIDEAFPSSEPLSATARPLDQIRVTQKIRTPVLLLFGAAGLVLLTACINVACLVLGRSVSRRREIATRLALGSGRLRLIRQLVTESLVLSVLGGTLGVALAHAGVAYFNTLGAALRFQMSGLERAALSSISLDTGTMVFCVAVVTVTPLLVGLLPAVGGSRLSLVEGLKTGAAPGSHKGTKGRGGLVITQVALAFTLLVGSGLLLRTIGRLNQANIGFDTGAMMTARIALPSSRYDRPASEAFFTGLLERVRALPGVQAAAFINCVPFADRCRNGSRVATMDGLEIEPDRSRAIGLNFVAPGYFRSIGVPVLRGRSFTTLDGIDTPAVVVIARETAGWLWPNEDPVGRSLSLLGTGEATVIGVVDDVRYDKVEELSRPDVYVSTQQFPRRDGYVVTRHSAESASHILAIREAVHGLDSELPLFDIQAMTDRANDATWRTRFSGVLISIFAVMTLILSAIGIYGLLSYSVERKAHDIGIMMALGATQKTALKNVVGSSFLFAAGGVALGILLAVVLTRFLQAMLFETSPHDPLTYGTAALVFVAVSLTASYFPARRASSVDPIEVLKTE